MITENREKSGYPPRSHDCQPAETEFADDYELTQQNLEMREENLKRKRSMAMWKSSLGHVWENHPIEATQKLIDRSNAQNHESNYRCRWGEDFLLIRNKM